VSPPHFHLVNQGDNMPYTFKVEYQTGIGVHCLHIFCCDAYELQAAIASVQQHMYWVKEWTPTGWISRPDLR
jgi:hypothetical protein